MRFKEFLAKQLQKTQLFEMAYSRQQGMEKARGVSDELVDHIIKICIFPDDVNVPHWKTEIKGWMNLVSKIKLKPNNKRLKYEDLYNELFDGPIEDVEGLTIRIKDLYKGKDISYIPENIEYNRLFKNIHYLYKTLCQDLSEDNYEGFEYYLNMLKD